MGNIFCCWERQRYEGSTLEMPRLYGDDLDDIRYAHHIKQPHILPHSNIIQYGCDT